jgi:hypothetical protein
MVMVSHAGTLSRSHRVREAGPHLAYGFLERGCYAPRSGFVLLASAWKRPAQTNVTKHITPESIRQRIASEQEQINLLMRLGLSSGTVQNASESHEEIVEVLMELLPQFR